MYINLPLGLCYAVFGIRIALHEVQRNWHIINSTAVCMPAKWLNDIGKSTAFIQERIDEDSTTDKEVNRENTGPC